MRYFLRISFAKSGRFLAWLLQSGAAGLAVGRYFADRHLHAGWLLGFGSSPKPRKQPVTGAFPIKITTPSSYILETNLTGAPADAIDIQANYVSLDLNGFAIIGTGSGTRVNAFGRTGVTIATAPLWTSLSELNGGQSGVVQNVRAQGNKGAGLDCGSDCVISGNIASANGGSGISVSGSNNLISDNTANGNKSAGINLNGGSHHRVSGNTANDNGTASTCAAGIAVRQGGTPITSPVTDCDMS